jgi:hypothetical protein
MRRARFIKTMERGLLVHFGIGLLVSILALARLGQLSSWTKEVSFLK